MSSEVTPTIGQQIASSILPFMTSKHTLTREECFDMVSKAIDREVSSLINQIKLKDLAKAALKEEVEKLSVKAKKWDALDDKISKFYFNDEGEEIEDSEGGDLCDIGEVAARAFGYL